ncbi:MAG TPA: glycosyltransferase family 2 protein [Anaerolineales bacterium]|nr:glycosyltransferase family 2 protein [Anaerolineales bacterium]
MRAKRAQKPRISIVIRAFNEEKHLGALLAAIQQQSVSDVEIILVDSGSTDGTLAIAAGYPVRVLHIKPGDFTFGRSLNLGLRAARGSLAVLASAHVLPLGRDWLKALLEPFEDPQLVIAYGAQRGAAGSRFSEAQHFLRWFPERADFNQANAYCNNANLALRLSLWKQQPFDETLTGLEDLAWASAWHERGYRITYAAEAGVTHFHEETHAQIVNRHRREAIALKRILPSSRFSLWHFASLFLRSVASDFRAALRQRVFLREAAGIVSFRFSQYLGTYLGYHDPLDPSSELKKVFYYPPGSLEDRSQKVKANIKEADRKSAKA